MDATACVLKKRPNATTAARHAMMMKMCFVWMFMVTEDGYWDCAFSLFSSAEIQGSVRSRRPG